MLGFKSTTQKAGRVPLTLTSSTSPSTINTLYILPTPPTAFVFLPAAFQRFESTDFRRPHHMLAAALRHGNWAFQWMGLHHHQLGSDIANDRKDTHNGRILFFIDASNAFCLHFYPRPDRVSTSHTRVYRTERRLDALVFVLLTP